MSKLKEFKDSLGISEIIASVLIHRGYDDVNKAAEFLGLIKSEKIDPMSIHGVAEAAHRILKACLLNEKIVIYGDYDVDGITGGSVFQEYLSRHTKNVSYYIPCRIEDGYGINETSFKKIAEDGANLVVTVDNGIGRWEVAELAKKIGVDLVVTDHHELPERLPDTIVVNPKIGNQLPYMAGVGVAYLVCSAIERIKPTYGLNDLLDLVAIGTIADMVPLIGVNRSLARAGLKVASSKKRIGLKELIEQNKIFITDIHQLKSNDIGFRIGPCLNAAGRIDRADAGVKLLTTKDGPEAYNMASKLLDINEKRKDVTLEVFEKVEKFIEDNKIDTSKPIIYYGEGNHHGVLGIVAARIMEKHGVPALILGMMVKDGQEIYSGSCRAPAGFHLANSINDPNVTKLIVGGGGHACAAGVSVPKENINKFIKKIQKSLKDKYDINKKPSLDIIDTEILLSDIDNRLMQELTSFQPTGQANPEVCFLSKNVLITEIKPFKTGTGFALKVSNDNGNEFRCSAFRMPDILEKIKVDDSIDIIYNLEFNFFPPGRPGKIELRLREILTGP